MIKVYDLNLQLVAYLENATAVSYETPFNELWTASFSLPADDPKNMDCLPLRYVEVFDGDERVDLFRIVPTVTSRDDGPMISYHLEHVLATLLDDVLFQYHQVGNLGVYTNQVLQYILGKQTTARWQLGTISFARQFEYKWENDNLLAALFSVAQPFVEPYMWTWDTSGYPWRLNLVEAPTEVEAHVRYGKNLVGITKEEDPTQLCTRLYPLGYGEGVNQLTIKEVNGGVPYLDADTSVVRGGPYPIVARVWSDRRFEHAETLKARAAAMLDEMKLPRLTYQVDAAELYRLTDDPADRFLVGNMVRVIDEELGIDIEARVVNRSRPDTEGAPGDVQIEIANRTQDIAGSISELADRQRINEVYAQGATNLDSHDFADNADPTHPAVIKFWIPEEIVRINKMSLSYETGPFRAYAKAVAAGGAVVKSTESGGGTVETTENGGGTVQTTASGGSTLVTASIGNTYAAGAQGTYKSGNELVTGNVLLSGNNMGFTTGAGPDGHTHTIPRFAYFISHEHQIAIPDHTHSFTDPVHKHTFTAPVHSHQINIPSHTHDIEYGIFEGPSPSAVTIEVDGQVIPGNASSGSDINIIPYLSKDSEGKINRGTWHEIKITPNGLARITANVVSQLFIQSRGGGDY